MQRYQLVNGGEGQWPVDLESWPFNDGLDAELLRGSDHEEDCFLDRFEQHLRGVDQWDAAQGRAGRCLAECALWDIETDGDWAELDVRAWLGAELMRCTCGDRLMELAQAFVFWLRSEGCLSARGQRRLQSRIQLQLRGTYTLELLALAA